MIKLYNGDCNEILEELIKENVHIDTVIADIPYNIKQVDWDNNFNLEIILPKIDKLLKQGENIIIFNGWSYVINIKLSLDKFFTIRNWIVYDRIKGRGAKINLVSTREDILWYSKGENNKPNSTLESRKGKASNSKTCSIDGMLC